MPCVCDQDNVSKVPFLPATIRLIHFRIVHPSALVVHGSLLPARRSTSPTPSFQSPSPTPPRSRRTHSSTPRTPAGCVFPALVVHGSLLPARRSTRLGVGIGIGLGCWLGRSHTYGPRAKSTFALSRSTSPVPQSCTWGMVVTVCTTPAMARIQRMVMSTPTGRPCQPFTMVCFTR